MTDEAIQQYFIQHHAEPICGRFKNEQLLRIVIDLPPNVFQLNMPFWKKFLVASLIVFSASVFPFETTVAGKVPTAITSSAPGNISNKPDLKHEPRNHKKKKRHRRGKLAWVVLDPGIFVSTMGMVGPVYDPIPIVSCIEIDSTKENNSLDPRAASFNNLCDLPADKKEPSPPSPVTAEFILPALLLKKRKNSNTAMD